MRGGIGQVARTEQLDSLLICFMSYVFLNAYDCPDGQKQEKQFKLTVHSTAVFANTSTAANDLWMTESLVSGLRELGQYFDGRIITFSACPPSLFSAIARINDLRHRAAQDGAMTASSATLYYDEAITLLQSIKLFSPLEWSHCKPVCRPGWELLGKVYQTAAALYCILSTQSLSILLVPTPELDVHSDLFVVLLQSRLKTALKETGVNRFLFWPLMVLGVAAAQGTHETRTFVAEELSRMSTLIGTSMPSLAKFVLEEFWASGKTGWDACFDRPYYFTTQISIDTSRIEA